MCCCFFFSSRRRHTRYWRDWSSDVCSSDLQPLELGAGDRDVEVQRPLGAGGDEGQVDGGRLRAGQLDLGLLGGLPEPPPGQLVLRKGDAGLGGERSEEYTPELQSRPYVECRV